MKVVVVEDRTLKSRCAVTSAIVLALFMIVPIAHGQVYKCTDADGKTTYADAPCDSRSKPLRLLNDSRANPTDPNMCAQLLDETQRLAEEADRDARRGRPPNADRAKRRQALTRQYEVRCAGISRAGGASK
jgi:hypothetical protein